MLVNLIAVSPNLMPVLAVVPGSGVVSCAYSFNRLRFLRVMKESRSANHLFGVYFKMAVMIATYSTMHTVSA